MGAFTGSFPATPLGSTGIAPVPVQPRRPVCQREQRHGHASCHHPGQSASRQLPGRDLQRAAQLQGPQMVRAAPDVSASWRAAHARGVGRGLWEGLTPASSHVLRCTGTLFSSSHPSFPPQPLHNWHDEPGYLFYSQLAASSQLQVRCPFSRTCYMPGTMLIFPSLVHLTLTKASSH